MKTPANQPGLAHAGAARAVVLWCVLAGTLVGGLLLVEPPDARGIAFWQDVGAFRLLADLILFHCVLLLPAFVAFRTGAAGASLEATGLVLLTGLTGLAMLNVLVGLDGPAFRRLCGFIVLVSAGGVAWGGALEDRRTLYYASAAVAAAGVPLIAFFCDELFGIDAVWLDAVSPFTAWRGVVDGVATSWAAWVVFGVVSASGVAAALRRRRKERRP